MHKISNTRKIKVRRYLAECLKFIFITTLQNERSPFCPLCKHCLINILMEKGRLQVYSKVKHRAYANYNLNKFESVKKKFQKESTINSLFSVRLAI